MKIFGLNILTDKQLEKVIANNNFEDVLKYFKVKKLYKIYCESIQLPKCDKCDENRELTFTLPDGKSFKTSCSCKKHKIIYHYGEVNPKDYYWALERCDKNLYLLHYEGFDGYMFYNMNQIDNIKNPMYPGLFTSEAKVKKAVKMLNDKNEIF